MTPQFPQLLFESELSQSCTGDSVLCGSSGLARRLAVGHEQGVFGI